MAGIIGSPVCLTYGVLPQKQTFIDHFEVICATENGFVPPPLFAFTNDKRVGTCQMTCEELWTEIDHIVNRDCIHGSVVSEEECEELLSWVSCVLGILQIEWI